MDLYIAHGTQDQNLSSRFLAGASHLSCDQQVCRSIVTVGWTVPLYVVRGHEASSFIGITLVCPILKDTPRFFEVARLCSKKN